MFLHLDSHQHPILCYGDLAFRIFGLWARYVSNTLQSIQLFFSVGLLTLSQGQAISQLSTGKICFAVCNLIFTIAGCALGQIRTLRRFKWLATLCIWINLALMALTFVSHLVHDDGTFIEVFQHGRGSQVSTKLCHGCGAESGGAWSGGPQRWLSS